MQPKRIPILDLLGEPEKTPRKEYVIPGTCPTCGVVPGTVSRPLTGIERCGLLDAGFKLSTNVHGDDIATGPKDGNNWNDALAHFHRAGHPKTVRPTWYERVLDT